MGKYWAKMREKMWTHHRAGKTKGGWRMFDRKKSCKAANVRDLAQRLKNLITKGFIFKARKRRHQTGGGRRGKKSRRKTSRKKIWGGRAS